MKKILLSVVCLMMVGMQSVMAQANITAPSLPDEMTLSDGMECYLYNADSELFWEDTYGKSGNYRYSIGNYGAQFRISVVNDTLYNLYRLSSSNYVTASGTGTSSSASATTANAKFRIKKVSGGYTIQRNSSYNEAQFVGTSKGSTQICDTITVSGNIVWKLMPISETTDAYMSKSHLYHAITSAAAYNTELYSQYIDMYNSTASTAEMKAAATTLDKALTLTDTVSSMTWDKGDYQMLFDDDPNHVWTVSSNALSCSFNNTEEAFQTLAATVVVDQDATFGYQVKNGSSTTYSSQKGILNVYIDNKLVRTVNKNELQRDWIFYEELSSGKHTIRWDFSYDGSNSITFSIKNVATYATPLATVTTKTGGQLKTQVMAIYSSLSDVKRLKVSGPLNSDDMAVILGMPNLYSLDMGEASLTDIPDKMFSRTANTDNKWAKLHKMVLPPNLKTIGANAFYQSYIDDIEFPTTLVSIGEDAFYQSRIREAMIPDGTSSIGSEAFNDCRSLTKVHFPAATNTIPSKCFNDCYNLEMAEIAEGVTTVESMAFNECYAMNTRLSSTISTIADKGFYSCAIDTLVMQNAIAVGANAFQSGKLKHLVVAEGSTLAKYAFAGNLLETVELPTTYYNVANLNVLSDNPTMKSLTLKCPTVITGSQLSTFLSGCGTDLTIRVPQYLLTDYRVADTWSAYGSNIVGFSTADVDFWQISADLTLDGVRFEGSPSVNITDSGSLTIDGNEAMNLLDLTVYHDLNGSLPARILSSTDNIVINGTLTERMYTKGNRWYFISLPFNFKVSDIKTENGAKFAIRYYDGASRATGATENWKDYASDDIVSAGTGFIFQTSKDQWTLFVAQDDADKQNIIRNQESSKQLEANYAETSANKGWNLVGNPYQCYYNMNMLNFPAPITTWSLSSSGTGTYKAYSIIDDQYVFKPNEAFFVQCPDEVNAISFLTMGKQLTASVETGASPLHHAQEDRKLVDVELSSGDMTDNTRIVFNDKAFAIYEQACDAGKFMSMDKTMPQIYSLNADATRYAINERPAQDGTVRLGLFIPADGTYSLSVSRNRDAGRIWLKDMNNGSITDLTDGAYTFTAEAGTLENRFLLVAGDVTAIREIADKTAGTDSPDAVFDMSGRCIESSRLTQGVYIVRQHGKARKVTVK